MKLARYWTREAGEAAGESGTIRVTARGWSDESMEAARAVARDIARRVAEGLASDRTRGKQYHYGDRPLPEPVLREFQPGGEGPGAVVTRNAYGSAVLNTRNLMFVDIDKEPPKTGGAGLAESIKSWFGKPKPVVETADPILADIQRVVERKNLAARVYRTAGGYRVLITSSVFDARDARSEALLREFGADPLYIRLCRMQECFRARLTPKPWRCGLLVPPGSYPFETPREQSRFEDWERKYSATIERYATCRYMQSFGSGPAAEGVEELMQYHDQETKAVMTLPLA